MEAVEGNVTSATAQRFLNATVSPDAIVSADEAVFYNKVDGYKMVRVNHSAKEYVNDRASTNGIESKWALLKRAFHGTYHHFSEKHVTHYLREIEFRQNEGNCRYDTMNRLQSLFGSMVGKTITYRELINA